MARAFEKNNTMLENRVTLDSVTEQLEYCDGMNALADEFLVKAKKRLEPEAFKQIFGFEAEEEFCLADKSLIQVAQ